MFKSKKEFIEALINGRQFVLPGENGIIYYDETKICPFRYYNRETKWNTELQGLWNEYDNVTEIKKEIDWSKVPSGTPVLVSDNNKVYKEKYFYKYDSELAFPYLTFDFGSDIIHCWKYIKFPEEVKIKDEWCAK